MRRCHPVPEATGLAFDSIGNLYAADLGGQISKITPDGTVSYFATGNYAALFIAVTDDTGHPLAVPPATLYGDYNRNGIVDAADYAVWRKGLGTTYTQNDYDVCAPLRPLSGQRRRCRSYIGQCSGT